MSEEALKFVSNLMDSLSLPYDFMEWKAKPPEEPIPDRYFVGESNELVMTTMEEDGRQDSTFILRGFTRKKWDVLMKDAQTIKNNLPITAILPNGYGIAVFYASSAPVPTGDAELKSIKINLDIKEWSVK